MFNAALFCRDENSSEVIEQLAVASNLVTFQRVVNGYPPSFELTRILNAHGPDMIFLDLSDGPSAMAAIADIRAGAPGTAIVGFGGGWEPGREAQFEAAGVTELLISPVTLKKFETAVERAILRVRGAIQENLFAFLPAKAGSGASTLALNAAGYLAATPLSRKVLLVDGDLRSGLISVALGLDHPFSVLDALGNSAQLDYSSWSKYVVGAGAFDALLSDRSRRETPPSWTSYHHLLDFAASRYDYILVDLPEVVNEATIEIVRRAKRVFVVSTPELAPLALAPQRCRELEQCGIPAEKIGLVINRWHRGDPDPEELARDLNQRLSGVFMNDYPTVRNAARAHSFVNPESRLGESFATFAHALAGAPAPPVPKPSFFKTLRSKPMPPPSI